MRLIPHIFISLLSLALTCYSDEVIHDAAEQASAEISERELGAFQRPKDGQDKNFADKRGEGVLAKITKMASFEKWKTFEDNYVKFSYPKEKDGYRWTERLSLPFVDGKLIRFDSSFYDFAWDHREAMMGTIPWMQEKAQPYEDPLVRGAEVETMPEDLKKVLLGFFLEKAKDADADFDGLCQVLRTLVRQGVQDEQALDIVRRRFAREGGQCAAWVLHEVGHKEDVALFVEKIREVYRVANQKHDDNIGLSSDLHNWLAFIPDDDERYPGLLREGLTSPNASVREESLFFIHTAPFPLDERLSFVRSALRDPNNEIRRLAARYYDRSEMSDNDWNLLKDAAEQEKDKFTLKEMNKVLEGREKQRTGK